MTNTSTHTIESDFKMKMLSRHFVSSNIASYIHSIHSSFDKRQLLHLHKTMVLGVYFHALKLNTPELFHRFRCNSELGLENSSQNWLILWCGVVIFRMGAGIGWRRVNWICDPDALSITL